MPDKGRHRREIDDPLAGHLAAGLTVREACARVGCSEKTGYRRAGDPAFRKKVSDLQAGMVRAASGKLTAGMTAASDTLVSLLASSDDGVRLRAAAELIKLSIKVRELADLEARVQALEAAGGTAPAADQFADAGDEP